MSDESHLIECPLDGKNKWIPTHQEEAMCFEIHNWVCKTWRMSTIDDKDERKKQMSYTISVLKSYIFNLEEILK